MRCRSSLFASIALACLLALPGIAAAQMESTSERLNIQAEKANTWIDGANNVVQVEGNILIELDHVRITAARGVVWLSPMRGKVMEHRRAEIAVIGNVTLQQDDVKRTGDVLYITADVKGAIRLTASHRGTTNASASETYQQALALRPSLVPAATQPTDAWLAQNPWPAAPASQPTSKPATQPTEPIAFAADKVDFVKTPEGHVAVTLTGSVKLFQQRQKGEFVEMQAARAVLFTPLRDLREAQSGGGGGSHGQIEDKIESAYLEGDVRIVHTPSPDTRKTEQRLMASRVFYEFATDRAVLTDAVLHTLDAKSQAPILIRAETLKQMSLGEYRGEKISLTTSSFNTPSYSLGIAKAYVRQIDTGNPQFGTVTQYKGTDVTLNAFDVPFIYLPSAAGTFTERGAILRDFELKSSDRLGFGTLGEFGLFESLGYLPPENNDATYQLGYYSKRGPMAGLNAHYTGGLVTPITKQPWTFEGDLKSFGMHDIGTDELGRGRTLIDPPTEWRGRFYWQHRHYLPDDWQLQATVGYVSDRTFMPEFFENEFNQTQPQDTSLYLKRQRDTEALTFLVSVQPNRFVTTADLLQEQFEVQRMPEITYQRIGDGIVNDNFTFFSSNTISGLEYRRADGTLADMGFVPGNGPGMPSLGQTGTTGNIVWRADTRQEFDYPFTVGQFRAVPYVMGRYTVYSDSPGGSSKDRVFGMAGLRLSTAFWKVDDTVVSELLDIHRLRHVIEPSVHVFASAQSTNRDNLFVFDEPVDSINDVSGVQLALSQRWQTKRGGAGQWRSVDVFTLNVEGNFFSKKPNDVDLAPTKFRGLFFDSLLETSVPRNSVNSDFTWRLSDTTAVLADVEYNLDKSTLATASIGLAAQRDQRLGYYIGTRYIEPLKSNITTVAMNYEITPKYTMTVQQSYDFGIKKAVGTYFTFIRHFDRFFVAVTIRYDVISKESGFGFSIWPEGLGKANMNSQRFGSVFGTGGGR